MYYKSIKFLNFILFSKWYSWEESEFWLIKGNKGIGDWIMVEVRLLGVCLMRLRLIYEIIENGCGDLESGFY